MSATKKRFNDKNNKRASDKDCAGARNTSPSSDDRKKRLLDALEHISAARVVLLICLLSFLAYANSLGGEFVFDDTEQIVENESLRSWDNLGSAFKTSVWAFRERSDNQSVPAPLPYYRPVFTAMLTIEYQLFGLWPQGWHLVNLLLHILCSIGVYYTILLMSRRTLVAAAAALLFSVYPVHAESVSWISGMTDPLFGVFFLASFYFYLKSRDAQSSGAGKGISARKSSSVPAMRGRMRLLMLSLILFAASAFSKETALSMVLLVFGYELIETTGQFSKRLAVSIKRSAPFLAVAVIYLIPRYLVLGEMMWSNPQAPQRPFAYTLLSLPFVICSYLSHLIWPVGLSVTYGTRFITSLTSPAFFLPLFLLLSITALLYVYRKSINREIWKALLLLLVPLLPVLNLGQVSQEEYLVFDHYLYLPVAGWTYLIALGLVKLASLEGEASTRLRIFREHSAQAALAVGIILLIGLAFAAARENRPWADSYSLWSNAARVRPDYWAPHYNTGLVLLKAERLPEARQMLEYAAALKPDEPIVYDALGRVFDEMGDIDNAIESFNQALDIDPEMFESLNNLGAVYFKARDYEQAEPRFAAALRLKPQSSAARFNLGLCYLGQARAAEAAREFERVVEAAPGDSEAHHHLGLAYEKMRRHEQAIEALQRGLDLARSRQLADKISESLSRLKSARR